MYELSSSGHFKLFVADAPSPPENLRAETLGPNSIRLTWDEAPPKNGQITLAYSAHYVPTKGKGTSKLIPTHKLSKKVPGILLAYLFEQNVFTEVNVISFLLNVRRHRTAESSGGNVG